MVSGLVSFFRLPQSLYIMEPGDVGEDSQVKELATDLRNLEVVMAGVLTQEKLRCFYFTFLCLLYIIMAG